MRMPMPVPTRQGITIVVILMSHTQKHSRPMSQQQQQQLVIAPPASADLAAQQIQAVSFEDVSTAAFRIRDKIARTSLDRAHDGMNNMTGMELWFKKDFLLQTGSFKERGARNALKMLTPQQRKNGVIAASAGNHALALAYHGADLAIPVTVVMPIHAPLMKVTKCKTFGATVLLKGEHIGEAKEVAMQIAKQHDLTYINGYDHPHIIAGQGTMGVEILEQKEDIDAVVVPIGGAGLIAGVALAIKTLKPEVMIIGVEPEKAASFTAALKVGKPINTEIGSTLADGLAVPCVGANAFHVARERVDKVVTVSEKYIALAILRLVELEKIVVEGGGAAGLAACLQGLMPELRGKRVVVPLCGGNIDTTVLGRCIERGLAADGRLCRFMVVVSDRPGGISKLAALLTELGVSIKDIFHERAWLESDVFSVQVRCVVETRDWEHAEILRQRLAERYPLVWGTLHDTQNALLL